MLFLKFKSKETKTSESDYEIQRANWISAWTRQPPRVVFSDWLELEPIGQRAIQAGHLNSIRVCEDESEKKVAWKRVSLLVSLKVNKLGWWSRSMLLDQLFICLRLLITTNFEQAIHDV